MADRKPREPKFADRAKKKGQHELDRRVSHGVEETDGSGVWGAEKEDLSITDEASKEMWYMVASAADIKGLTNAARHMRHYLDNTGAPLTIDADVMMRDVSSLREAYEVQLRLAQEAADMRITEMNDVQRRMKGAFSLEGRRHADVYCDRSLSEDWFFAIGGFTYYYVADVKTKPPAKETASASSYDTALPEVEMTFRLEIRDRYNWDQGKAVTLAGITVTDEQLGRLHKVGIANEYDVLGVTSSRTLRWAAREFCGVGGAMSTGGFFDRSADAPTAGIAADTRLDPTRNRR